MDEPEHQTTGNASDATERDKRRTTESALPLPTDVVRLPAHHVWDVGIGSCTCEEYAGILRWDARCPAHHAQSDDGDDGVCGDDRSTNAILVCYPCGGEHDNTGECVCQRVSTNLLRSIVLSRLRLTWWSNKTLRLSDAETHATVENLRQEVC